MPDASPHEIVILYDAQEQIQSEMKFADFEAVLEGRTTLPDHAASKVRAAYCLVGNGLTLRSIVFFVFGVDEEGGIDPSFNLPLRYMALHAGAAQDLGNGKIRKASRGQCPVPWHSVNLWEPGENGLEDVQKRIYRNKLKLKSVIVGNDEDWFEQVEALDDSEFTLDLPTVADKPASTQTQTMQFNARLAELFGDAGKLSLQDLIRLHAEQLDLAQAKHRDDIESQQLAYLEQLRNAREEIHELKVALRQEQGRNRRLQQMLRGDI